MSYRGCRQTYWSSVGRISVECRPTVDRVSIDCQSSIGRVPIEYPRSNAMRPPSSLFYSSPFSRGLCMTLVPLSLLRNRTETLATQDKSCPSYGESNKGSKERQGPTLGVRQFTDSLRSWRYCVGARLMHQSIQPAPSPLPPGLLRGICPPCQSRRWGICKFCKPRGPGQKSFWRRSRDPKEFLAAYAARDGLDTKSHSTTTQYRRLGPVYMEVGDPR